MMRDLYHLEVLSAKMINERLTTAANDRLLPPFRPIRRMARWVGLLLIRLGARLLRYAHARHTGRPSYVR
ncbi:hypothetical protein [Chloroflexus sp.]